MNSFEYSGIWWLPSNPENKVAGTLKFSRKIGFSLELIGSFGNFNISSFYQEENDKNLEIIIGIVPKKLITLYNCYHKHFQLTAPGLTTQNYGAKLAFLGHHFDNKEQIKFKNIQVDFTYLNDLSPFYPSFDIEGVPNNSNPNYKVYNQNYTIFDGTKASITKGYISIKQFVERKFQKQQITLNKCALIEFNFKEAFTLNDILQDYIKPLRDFITLISNQPNFIEKLYAFLDGSSTEIEIVFYESNYIEKRNINQNDFLLSLEDIEQYFGLIMQRWFNFYDEGFDIIGLYFSTIYNSRLYVENEFLSLVQALESLHRRIFDRQKYNTDSHRVRLNKIIESVPIEYQDWLSKKLEHSHEPTLADRLIEIINLTKETVEPLILDVDEFVKNVKKIRNYLTHYGESTDAELLIKNDIFRINQVLDFTVKAFLLTQLGCKPDFCYEKISCKEEYRYLKNLVNKKRNE